VKANANINPAAYRQWLRFVQAQRWQQGHLDQSCWDCARLAAKLRLPQALVFNVLADLVRRAGDVVKVGKIWSQVHRAYGEPHRSSPQRGVATGTALGRQGNPTKFDPRLLSQTLAEVRGAIGPNAGAMIRQRSPLNPDYITPASYVGHIFRPGELVLAFTELRSQGDFVFEVGSDMRFNLPVSTPAGVWLLSNPVDGHWHPNPRQGGELSRRSRESVTSFRYALLESDHVPAEEWLPLLAVLPLPFVSICESGGDSIHALIHIGAATHELWETRVRGWKQHLIRLGADQSALRSVQLARLPQAWRGERQQKLLFLDPNGGSKSGAILHRPPRPLHADWIQFVRASLANCWPITSQQAAEGIRALHPFSAQPAVADTVAILQQHL